MKKQTKKKNDEKIVFHGEIIGTPRDRERFGNLPLLQIKLDVNGSMLVTLGNDSFLPSKKDLIETRDAMNSVAKVLGIEKAKVIVGAWMDRIGPR